MIGLDTGHLVYNYGTKLQAYAMQTLLERNGDKCEIIQWHTKDFGKLWRLADLLKDVQKIKRGYGWRLHLWPKVFARYRVFNEFNAKLHIRKYYGTFNDMLDVTQSYDKVFCGSDQAWLPGNVVKQWYTLEFCGDRVFKAAYAPSFGIDAIDKQLHERYAHFLNRLDAISVREISGGRIIKELTGKDIPIVLDPTLLLRRNDWETLRSEATIKISEPYLFCYLLGKSPDHRKRIKDYAKCKGLKIVNIQHFAGYCKADVSFADYNLYEASPQDFIRLISEANYVCTDSFHCTAFSVQYHKDFSVFHRFKKSDKASTNTRIYSILEQLGLQNRIVEDGDDVRMDTINYEDVDRRLEALRKASTTYMDNCLNGRGNV